MIKTSPSLDLGSFDIENYEPTRNLTSKLTFQIYLSFPEDAPPEQVQRLQRWLHRLREQILITVRVSDAIVFLDPELKTFRHHILYRINRILKPLNAQDVLFVDFMFSAS